MVAVFDVVLDTAGSDNSPGTETILSSVMRFKTEDGVVVDTNNPIPIPGAGVNLSYWRQIFLDCTTAPDTQVDNIKFYSDGATGWGAGVEIYIAGQFPVHGIATTTGYDLATGVVGTSGDAMETGGAKHTDVTTRTNVETHTSGSPLSGPTISEPGGIINATGETSNYIVLQCEVGTTGTPGAKTAETLTFQYDEI